MAEYTKQDIFDIITEYLEQYGSQIGTYSVRELTPAELTDETLRILTIPSMMPDTEEWVQTSLRNMLNPIDNAVTDLTTLKQQTAAARDSATQAASSVSGAITQAERVNASLVGYTVTITDHNGNSNSVNIGFEIYRTYTSVSAMEADAANVPQGKFVIIATTDATSADNAKMYCKNSQGTFTFLCDLDQASSAAWADWLTSMKPAIESAITTAGTDHTTAYSDHQTADADHQTAVSDHTKAGTDHSASVTATGNATTQANRAKAWADHPPFIGNGTTGDLNYWYIWDETTQAYVKNIYAKGDNLDWETITQEERELLIQEILNSLVFATDAACENIINELV